MSDIKLTGEQEAVLRSQVFDDRHPGALLHDFALVLDYVGEKGVKAGGKYNLLPIEAVSALDGRLARPLRLALQRPQLRSHPYLQGLHLVLRASGLARVEGTGAKARLALDPAVLRSWHGLNPTEQYFALLEAWVLHARGEMVGMPDRFDGPLLDRWGITVSVMMSVGGPVLERVQFLLMQYGDTLYNVALADLFGLVALEHPHEGARAWAPASVQLTPFGQAMFMLLGKASSALENWEAEEETDEPEAREELNPLQPVLQPYFPAWQKKLAVSGREAQEGVYVFKVSLGRDVWRRIALAHDHTLEALVHAILNSMKFDFDHLYEFIYRDALGRTVRATHEVCDSPVHTDEVEIGTLPLKPGDSMTFRYDFGDDWRFNVKLERIDPPGSLKKLPRVVEKHGKAPEQYPRWE
jgi:hypothetical protein